MIFFFYEKSKLTNITNYISNKCLTLFLSAINYLELVLNILNNNYINESIYVYVFFSLRKMNLSVNIYYKEYLLKGNSSPLYYYKILTIIYNFILGLVVPRKLVLLYHFFVHPLLPL